jgi:hypothetical protein
MVISLTTGETGDALRTVGRHCVKHALEMDIPTFAGWSGIVFNGFASGFVCRTLGEGKAD